ncbi:helix-turn-helix domain-containing protein [Burkholderia anthina]|uniref:helix-turn-helix domain-containing protein n=1 Tax=Burkholderia anthina TaxID=179879 RepID=UPI001588B8E6|nr:helix-turn-helix transcriptional regulator [Burkholderia anthina]
MESDNNEFEPWLRTRLSNNLRRLRAGRGFSQETLSAECGFHRTYISQVERAVTNISVDNLQKIAVALGVEPASLLQQPPDSTPLSRDGSSS